MTTTTTRSRATAPSRRPTARRGSYGGYVDGANALQIGYADPVAPDEYLDDLVVERDPVRTEPSLEPDRVAAAEPTPADAVALPRASFLALVIGVAIAAVLGVLVLNTKINENSFALDQLRSQQAALDMREQQLTQQLANLESTGNLMAQAQRLGLVPAGSPAYLTLPNGKVVGVPQPASGPAVSSGTANSTDPGR
jgi:hypothetical protein